MARPPTGSVVEREGKHGRVFALRFRAYGARRYLTTEAQNHQEAERELRHVLADVERGVWQPPRVEPAPESLRDEPTFHVYASEWVANRVDVDERTTEYFEWA